MNGRLLLGAAGGTLLGHPLRSALVVLTLAIGMAAVVAANATTDGLARHVRQNTQRAGRRVTGVHKDLFYAARVFAGGLKPEKRLDLRFGDLARLSRDLPRVAVHRPGGGKVASLPVAFIPAEMAYALVAARGRPPVQEVSVATTEAYRKTGQYDLAAGRFLERADTLHNRPVCVLDSGVALEIFGKQAQAAALLGRRVTFQRGQLHLDLKVVGVLEEAFLLRKKFQAFDTVRHGRPAIFARLNMKNLYLPVSLVTRRPPPGAPASRLGGVSFRPKAPTSGCLIHFPAGRDQDLEAYNQQVTRWGEAHKLALFVLPQWRWLDLVGSLAGSADVAGGVIWIVILLVTMIMILVINLVVVRERFHEVAVRRTEGARRGDILLQFLIESGLLACLGWLLGVLLGVLGARLLSDRITGWPPAFHPGHFLLAFLAALLVALLATLLPALQAARLDPVKVLMKR